jgi:hypothetical protein
MGRSGPQTICVVIEGVAMSMPGGEGGRHLLCLLDEAGVFWSGMRVLLRVGEVRVWVGPGRENRMGKKALLCRSQCGKVRAMPSECVRFRLRRSRGNGSSAPTTSTPWPRLTMLPCAQWGLSLPPCIGKRNKVIARHLCQRFVLRKHLKTTFEKQSLRFNLIASRMPYLLVRFSKRSMEELAHFQRFQVWQESSTKALTIVEKRLEVARPKTTFFQKGGRRPRCESAVHHE